MSLVALLLAVAVPAALGDPALEARADALEMEIRCVQCQNEPIAQSTADIASDMRALVRERIVAGDSDDQIRAFFRQRYGDFVLFRPPWDARTWALWASPLLLFAAGLTAAGVLRNRRGARISRPKKANGKRRAASQVRQMAPGALLNPKKAAEFCPDQSQVRLKPLLRGAKASYGAEDRP